MLKFKDHSFYYLFICIALLLGAYFIEYILGYKPCVLCSYQRIPYFITIIFISTYLKLKFSEKFLYKILLIIFLLGLILALYHVGVENNIFTGLERCSGNSPDSVNNLSEMKDIIFNKAPSCNHVEFKILSLSLAVWNSLIMSVLSYLSMKDLKRINAR